MVYVEEVKVNGKRYYKLVQAIRKGNKVTHKSKYVGKSLPNKSDLEKIKKNFLLDVLSEKSKYLSKEELEKVESKKEDNISENKKLSQTEKDNKLKEFVIRFTYDSSKLSGVRLTLRQTYLILKEGIMPNDLKNLKVVKGIENHEKGIIIITLYKGSLTLKFIRRLHNVLLSGIDDEIAGKLRSELKRDVKIAGTSYVLSKWDCLDKELNSFFKWYKSENRKLHPLELAALVHLKMISIQPFVDGNSRLSRLLMNWILWKKNYPFVNIPIEDIENYYNALDMYQVEKNEKPFIEYILKKYLKD